MGASYVHDWHANCVIISLTNSFDSNTAISEYIYYDPKWGQTVIDTYYLPVAHIIFLGKEKVQIWTFS